MRPRSEALCAHVFRKIRYGEYSKYHAADFGSRFYLCGCGAELALLAKLGIRLGKPSHNKLKWDICHRRRTRFGEEYIFRNKGPYL